MQTSIWFMIFLVVAAGALGGVVNAFMTDNGFALPRHETTPDKSVTILRPGYFGNVMIGAVAALISWGLYGPLSSMIIVSTGKATEANTTPAPVGLTLASFVGAILVGIGGAKWLTNEVDKKLLRATAAEAASKQPSPDASQQIAQANPAQALYIAQKMK
jgi:hypothetical protein